MSKVQEVNWELPFLIINSLGTISWSRPYQIMCKKLKMPLRISLTQLPREIYTLVMELKLSSLIKEESQSEEALAEEIENFKYIVMLLKFKYSFFSLFVPK